MLRQSLLRWWNTSSFTNKEVLNEEYGKQWEIKLKKLESGHFTLWKCSVPGALQGKQYRASFSYHLECPE